MADTAHAEALSQFQQLIGDKDDLTAQLAIIRISEPIFSEAESENANRTPLKRGSDASTLSNPTPASLETDLAHYKVRIEISLYSGIVVCSGKNSGYADTDLTLR